MRRHLTRAVKLAALGKELVDLSRSKRAPGSVGQIRVVERLVHLHGLPQKIGQILSLAELDRDDPVFTRLVETLAPLPAATALAQIDRALGRPWRDCFRFVDPNGIGASLAQVHRATLHDGRDVAVKIQYPEIAEALDLDLKALGWLTMPVGGLRRGFDVAGYRREVGEMLRQELDYRSEAEMIRRFRSFVSTLDGVYVPDVIEEFSGTRILTMTWIDGEPFSESRTWSEDERRRIGTTLLSLFLASVFAAHMIHADPHPGNYRFQRMPRGVTVGLLDFGCVKILTPETAKALHGLIADTVTGRLTGNTELAKARFERLGFQPLLLAPMQHLLPRLCEILFEPFLQDRPFNMTGWHLGARVEATLGEFRWNFRMAGPPSLIYFMRAYQGLVQYLSALDVPVNWRAAYERIVTKQCEELPSVTNVRVGPSAKSRTLRIRVTRGGRTKADLILPVAAAECLSELIPPEVGPKLAARNIDVFRISRSVTERNFPPGDLFSLRDGKDDFRVWLE